MQPQPPVACEHRDRFRKIVERLALDADQRVEAPLQIEPLGDVVEQIGDAAFGIGRRDHAQRAPVRQMPEEFARLERAIGFVQLGFPLPEILLLRQFAGRAQPVEHGGIARVLIEETGIEIPERTISGIVECQRAVGAENGDAGRELVERAAMGVDHAGEFGAHALDFGGVDRDAGAAAPCRHFRDVENAPRAGRDRGDACREGLTGGSHAGGFVAFGAVEQFEPAVDRVGLVLGFDRVDVSGVDEAQRAIGVARPDRRGQRIEQAAKRGHVGLHVLVLGFQFVELLAQAPHVAQPHHRASADGAAFRFHRMAGNRGQRHRETFAVVAQRLDRTLHRKRLVGRQPQAESQHALRLSRRRNDCDIADDFGLVGGGRPGHHDLRLREEQRMRAIDIGGERGDLLAEKAVGFGGLPAAAHQQDRIHHRETQNAERQPERREFMPLEFGEGGDIEIDRRELARVGGMGRQWKAGQRETREESASPRIGVAPPASCRDHACIPLPRGFLPLSAARSSARIHSAGTRRVYSGRIN